MSELGKVRDKINEVIKEINACEVHIWACCCTQYSEKLKKIIGEIEMAYVKCLFCGNSIILKFPSTLEVIETQMKEHLRECTKVDKAVIINPLSFFEMRDG